MSGETPAVPPPETVEKWKKAVMKALDKRVKEREKDADSEQE